MNGCPINKSFYYFSRLSKTVSLVLISSILLLFSSVSCSEPVEESEQPVEKASDKIYLVTDDTPNCSMVISDEVFNYLKNDDDYSYILDLMSDYFNIVINNEIDANTVYIRAVTEKIDAEVRLAEVYYASNKVSLLIQMAEAGKSIFSEHNLNSEEEVTVEPEKTHSKFYSELNDSLKTVADKGSVYSVKAIKEEFIEKTNQIYSNSEKIISNKNIKELKYGDYYIDIDDDNGISIVCGSMEAVMSALDYFLTEYVQMGTSDENYYLINVPDSKLHAGHYLRSTIAGKSVGEYSIIYYCNSTYYDSRENAKFLKEYFLKNYGVTSFLKDTDSPSDDIKHKIIIGKTRMKICEKYYENAPDIMDYSIVQSGNDLYILGGSDWAIKYAIDYLIDEFFSKEKSIPSSFTYSGNMYGENVFENKSKFEVRIMSNNVWNCERNKQTWLQKGADCSNRARNQDMARVFIAYAPDVLCLQELNPMDYFSDNFLNDLNATGMSYKYVKGYNIGFARRNFTPILYNTDTLTLIESGSYIFPKYVGQNSDTKSYTWGYFQVKKTGFRFIAFSTHLWWKRDAVQPGSSKLRAKQMSIICEEADNLIKKYSCPCFVMGDFNCRSSASEFLTMSKNGFYDCHEIATDYSSNLSGRYVCNENTFSYKPNSGTYKRNSIDHILVKNLKKANVSTYNYVLPNFYGKLSDHAPVYIDLKVRA